MNEYDFIILILTISSVIFTFINMLIAWWTYLDQKSLKTTNDELVRFENDKIQKTQQQLQFQSSIAKSNSELLRIEQNKQA